MSRATPESIKRSVEDCYGLEIQPGRGTPLMHEAKSVAAYLIRSQCRWSAPDTAAFLGWASHSSVIYAEAKVIEWLAEGRVRVKSAIAAARKSGVSAKPRSQPAPTSRVRWPFIPYVRPAAGGAA